MKSNTQPSLESAIAGQYNFNIKSIFIEAWEKTEGFKGTFWIPMVFILTIIAITSGIAFGVGALIEGTTSADLVASPHPSIQLIEMVFSIFLITPLFAGLLLMTIKHCVGESVPSDFILKYFKYWKQFWIYPVVMTAIGLIKNFFLDYDSIQLLMFLLIVFITVTYFMFIPLVVEKKLAMWPALEASRKTIFHHWFKVLGFFIVIVLICIVSTLTLGIAYIWTMPLIFNANAILYRDIFGVSRSS